MGGSIFSDHFIANLLLSLPVNKNRKVNLVVTKYCWLSFLYHSKTDISGYCAFSMRNHSQFIAGVREDLTCCDQTTNIELKCCTEKLIYYYNMQLIELYCILYCN